MCVMCRSVSSVVVYRKVSLCVMVCLYSSYVAMYRGVLYFAIGVKTLATVIP